MSPAQVALYMDLRHAYSVVIALAVLADFTTPPRRAS